MVQTKTPETSRAVVTEEHVGFFEKAMHHFQTFVASQIERQAALSPVIQLKWRIDVVPVQPPKSSERVPFMGFNFDDLGTPISQDPATCWASHPKS
jgi:hypothetical protein